MTYNEELRQHQFEFTRHIGFLINYVYANGLLTLTFGRAYDLPEVQPILLEKGLTNTLDSQHPKRLAVDFNFFQGNYYLFSDPARREQDFKLVLPVGEYWEDLDKLNRWGGRWKKPFDPFHFQRNFK